MTRFTCICAMLFLAPFSVAMADPDYSELQAAAKTYADKIPHEDDMGAVSDPVQAKKIIDDWADANDALADKFLDFEKAHPEIMQDGAMPPEMQAIKDKVDRLWLIHSTIPKALDEMVKRFTDRGVDAALTHLIQAQLRVKNLGVAMAEETKKDSPYISVVSDGQCGDSPTISNQVAITTPEAVERWRKAAAQGDAKAQAHLGRCYNYGIAIPQDLHEALTWYEKAANQGNLEGILMTGIAYEYGKGTVADGPAAIKWFRAAADNGAPLAEAELGSLYMAGKCVPRDEAEGMKWLHLAADAGEKHAELMLGICTLKGDGIEKDDLEGMALLVKSSDHGLALAQFELAERSLHADKSIKGMEKADKVEAESWMKKSAEQGQAGAEFMEGLLCRNGTGREVDFQEAARWFRASALQGFPRGENAYGYALSTGGGTEIDVVEAYKWYTLALAQREDDEARVNAQISMRDLLPQMTPDQIQEGKDRAAHFVPVIERHQQNDIIAAGEEMGQKPAPLTGND